MGESDCDIGVVITWERVTVTWEWLSCGRVTDIGVVITWERVTVTWEWLSCGRE